jgi:hypothetical protein
MTTFFVLGIADNRIVGTIILELLACLWTAYALKADKRNTEAGVNTGTKEFVKQAS